MPYDLAVQKKLQGYKVRDVTLGDQLTNRELREKTLLSLARKFKPHLAKALKTMLGLIENPETPAATKYQASKFVIEFYKSLGEAIYKDRYDDESGEEIQTESAPVFSLTVIPKKQDGTTIPTTKVEEKVVPDKESGTEKPVEVS